MAEINDHTSSCADTDELDPSELLAFFAIVPQNDDAIRNFSAVCDQLLQQPLQPSNTRPGSHHLKFIRHSEVQVSLPQSFSSESDSEAQVERAPISQAVPQVWKGRYVLIMNKSYYPIRPTVGWSLGSGTWNETKDSGGVDILLGRNEHLYSRHAVFQFDANGKLCFKPRHRGIFLAGKELKKDSLYPVPGNSPTLRIGKLVYELQYTVLSEIEPAFQTAKSAYLLTHGIATEPPPALTSATPSETTETVGKWTLLGVTGATDRTAVMGAYRNMGGFDAAVKTVFRSDRGTAAKLADEIKIYRDLRRLATSRLSRYWHFIMQLEEVVYPDGETWIEKASLTKFICSGLPWPKVPSIRSLVQRSTRPQSSTTSPQRRSKSSSHR